LVKSDDEEHHIMPILLGKTLYVSVEFIDSDNTKLSANA
jgi:hypothetical protein